MVALIIGQLVSACIEKQYSNDIDLGILDFLLVGLTLKCPTMVVHPLNPEARSRQKQEGLGSFGTETTLKGLYRPEKTLDKLYRPKKTLQIRR